MPNKIKGEVVSISESGNLISDISVESVADAPQNESVIIKFGGHETFGIHPQEHGQPDATMVASNGKSGFVEIEIVGIPLAGMLGIKVGEAITITW